MSKTGKLRAVRADQGSHAEKNAHGRLDPFAWFALSCCALLGFGMNILYPEAVWWQRVLLSALAFSGGLFAFFYTKKGKAAWAFALEARTEFAKVVWPDYGETRQATWIVALMVVIMSLLLWLLDSILLWIISWVTA